MEILNSILTAFLFIYEINTKVNDRYYPRYHFAPPYGLMNDPNGLSYFRGEYHLFYQFNPNSSLAPGKPHWGHAKSRDLFHWKRLPIAMYPNEWYDRSGVFSGSALIEHGKMYLFYTGHVNNTGETPDHVERQALATSEDGVHVMKYENNPILYTADHQPDIRDPKVWRHGDTYYMVLGNSFNNHTLGRVLLYASKDKINWSQVSILGESDGQLGYMWECPDFFQLNGRFILLFSPQGVKAEGDKYRNLYQTGYFVGDFDYKTLTFKKLTQFLELDHGHDFYATQTLLDEQSRRIVVAWFDMWDQGYPEGQDGFTGQMTIPRALSLTKDLRLIQQPVAEIRNARSNIVHSGFAAGGTSVTLDDKAGQINIRTSALSDLELHIESENAYVVITYSAINGTISLDRGGEDGIRRTEWRASVVLVLNIYIDASSVEVFCGDGEVTFSSRYFPDGPVNVRLGNNNQAIEMRVFNMKRTISK